MSECRQDCSHPEHQPQPIRYPGGTALEWAERAQTYAQDAFQFAEIARGHAQDARRYADRAQLWLWVALAAFVIATGFAVLAIIAAGS